MRLDQFPNKTAAIEYLRAEMGCASAKDAEEYLRKHLPKESYYQDKIIKFLKDTYPTAFVWKAAAGPYSRQGIPDVCAVINGRYYGFEVKRPYIGVLSTIQEQTIEKIRAAGGVAAVVCFPEEVKKIIEETQAAVSTQTAWKEYLRERFERVE